MKAKTLLLIPLIASVISCGSGGSKNKLVQQDTDFIRTSEDIKEKRPIHPPSSAVRDFSL